MPLVPLTVAPPPSTASSAIVFNVSFEASPIVTERDWSDQLGEPGLPEGIDYERWTRLVSPAPRGEFADRLDVLDLFED